MRTVIYQLFVRHFGADERDCGKFNKVNDRALEKLAEMGVTHLWLTGVLRHATSTSYAGLPAHPACVVKGKAGSPYAVTDYFDVDPDLAVQPEARLDEFRKLVARVRKWGMVPMMDFVPNHVSRCYSSVSAPESDFGKQDRTDVFFDRNNSFYYLERGGSDGRMMLPGGEFMPERGHGRVTGNNAATWTPSVNDWYETVKLNYGFDYRQGAAGAEALPGLSARREELPRTWLLMDAILAWWQNLGIGGFRCDMAHMVPLPFWRREIAQARMRQNVFFAAEAYNDNMKTVDGDVLSALLSAGFDAVYDAEAYHGLRELYEGTAWANDLDEHHRPENPLFVRGVRYVENHDEPRLASPLYWNNRGEQAARALMVAQYATSCGPILFYNGQETAERADTPCEFGGNNGRTSIFDYTTLPRFSLWYNNGKCDAAQLPAPLRELRDFCCRLLRLLHLPVFANGSFYGLNWANKQTVPFGRCDGETSSGHYVYAFLRHDSASRSAALVVCNFLPDKDVHVCVRIPQNACDWARRHSDDFCFSDLLTPENKPIRISRDTLLNEGIPLDIRAGDARILAWE